MSENHTEVTQESKERLEVLDLVHTPRPEKLARETALLEGANEVRFAERAFRPRHPATIDEVRAGVDALHLPVKRALPEPALPPAPEPPTQHVPDALRNALETAMPDALLLTAEVVYKTDKGQVVEATFELDNVRRTEQYIIEDGKARPMDDVGARIDALPAPKAPAAPAPPPPPAPPTAAIPEPPKKGRFSFGRKSTSAQPPAPAPESKPEPEKKGKFSFRRGGKQ